MRKFFLVITAVLLTNYSVPACASDFYGYVAGIFVISGKAVVALNNGSFNGAVSPCSSATDSAYYVIDIGTAFGRMEYANALSAKVTGHRVYVHGDNGCSGNPYGPVGAEGMLGIDLRAD